ncbi:S-adenosyl-L-methionine-dependent methyltransferases superfamily protein [Striga hermonthica]|uniref:S-adenosyl-L-methionine-dependent methyltransferases superfamily protein n=1 Tax=Striga hermonthica TaxID=68872 RepID=A0A9N7NGU7_STRHE|nr:S-adenosyl-L-methionine-dependent methyltransferases superfamily protein [Striga hermonthica]
MFHVHFSDHVLNDFNTLFKSLPPNRDYHVSGVPSTFHGRLFPRDYLHIVHCSLVLHWLSRASTVKNSGKIFYTGAPQEVIEAYLRQHAYDMSKFLDAQAQEVVSGGLVMLVMPACPDGVPHSKFLVSVFFDMLGDCLVDLARKGIIEENKVDEFNLPMFFTSPQEFEQTMKQNQGFSMERMEVLPEVNGKELFPRHVPHRASNQRS